MPRVSLNHAAYLCQESRRRVQLWARDRLITVGPDRLVDTDELIAKGLLRRERAHLPLPRRTNQGLLREILQGQQDLRDLLVLLLDELRAIRELVTRRPNNHPC